ncbi:MAG: methylenetetrahydrofolate reductase [Deltaproteobacteria bacterium]|nr:methylenetetrahydrofolate reductase [Deltaproteobacteria bacterium]
MKVTEHLDRADEPLISVEIIPPKRGANIADFHRAVESIVPFHIPFINVTSHAADVEWQEQPDGSYRRRVKRKSPGTFGLCAMIKYKYNIDPVPHILCRGYSREETEDALIELNYLGIENILAIRGDGAIRPVRAGRTANVHASDLIEQIQHLNEGRYQDDLMDPAPTSFCVGAACYPEKHFESPNLAFDLQTLRQKEELGATYVVAQMLFDNGPFFDFVARARAAGITIPILPGLKIVTSKRQLTSIPAAFHVDIPEELTESILAAKSPREVREIGIAWAEKQTRELMDAGLPGIHFYIMQKTGSFVRLMDRLGRRHESTVAVG